MRNRPLFGLFLLLFSSVAWAAPAKEPLTFRARLTEDLGTLDWNYGEVNPEVVYQMMEGLFRADGKGQPQAAAARYYRWNADKTELVVQLKPERRWSDGAPLCAQQFVDSWDRLRDKTFASPYAHFAHLFKSYEAKSCRELRIRFERPSPEAPALLSHYVFFPVRLDQLKKTPKIFNLGGDLLVNGPFRLVDWKPNQSLTLARNEAYGGQKPALERVEFLFIPDDNTAQLMFEQKKIDWVKDVPPLLRTAATEKGPSFRIFPALVTFYFGVHAGESALLKDPAVRRALNESLDRKEIPKVLGKEFTPTATWLSRAVFAQVKPVKHEKSWEEAKKKIQAAVAAGKMDIVLRVYGKSVHRNLAEWAQGQWEKKLGVRVPVEVQEAKVYWRELGVNPPPIFLSGVTAPYGHPRAFLQEFLSTSTANWTGWSSDEYDRAVNEEKFQAAEDILSAAAVVIPLYSRDTVALLNPRWKGFAVNPLGQVFLKDVGP